MVMMFETSKHVRKLNSVVVFFKIIINFPNNTLLLRDVGLNFFTVGRYYISSRSSTAVQQLKIIY